MTSLEKKPASFYKIFFCYFSSKLRIPIQFVKEYGEILPQISLLETGSGESWDVKIIQLNEGFYLTDGWAKFVKDNQITNMDFLVFNLVCKSTFQVAIYGMEGCPKEPSYPEGQHPPTYGEQAGRPRKFRAKEKNSESAGGVGKMRSFSAVVRKHYKNCMDIPKDFAVKTGIARKSAIKLQNVQGKGCRVEIVVKQDGRICMGEEWNSFRLANNLVSGSKCTFEFDASSGVLVMRRQWEMSSSKRGRGRPPKRADFQICNLNT